MTREEAIKRVDGYLTSCLPHECYGEVDEIIKALKQEPCEDCVSRQAVEDKLLKLCNELEGIFSNIRMQNQDESVCSLCEYDCPAHYECPGFDKDDCFKLADKMRHEWQSTKDLPSVTPKPMVGKWINKGSFVCYCSICGCKNVKEVSICPWCKSKMEVWE